MSRYKRLPRSVKKQPDEFVSTVDHTIRFVLKHKKMFGLLCLVVVFSGISVWFTAEKRQRNLDELSHEISLAETAENRTEAFQEILDRFGSYTPAQLTRLSLAEDAVKKGDLAHAAEQLDTLVPASPDFLKLALKIAMAKILWQEGKTDSALAALDGLTAGSDREAESSAEFLRAMILESTGKTDLAVNIYTRLASTGAKNPAIARKAVTRLVLLSDGEGGNNK